MPYEFKLPDLGEGLTEGEIARWLVSEGQEIAEDDPLVEIQTDKTTVEIPSPAAGKVTRILAAEGDVVPVGTVIVVIGDGAPTVPPPTPTPTPTPTPAPARGRAEEPSRVHEHKEIEGPVRATPLVRRVAQELGVDLTTVTGTGPQGRITEEDVRGAGGAAPGPTGERREKVRGVRRLIAERLTASHREIPAVTFAEECDFTDVDLARLVPLA